MINNKGKIELSFEFLLSDSTNAKKFTEELNKIATDKISISVISNILIPE